MRKATKLQILFLIYAIYTILSLGYFAYLHSELRAKTHTIDSLESDNAMFADELARKACDYEDAYEDR